MTSILPQLNLKSTQNINQNQNNFTEKVHLSFNQDQQNDLLLNNNGRQNKKQKKFYKGQNLQQQQTYQFPKTQRYSLNRLPNNDSKYSIKKMSTKIETYQQIQQYKKVSQHLDVMQKLKKVNSQKLKKLQKNILNLDFLRKLSVKQTLKIQNRKNKVEQAEKITYWLSDLRNIKERADKQKLVERRKMCTSLRQNNQRAKQISQALFNIVRQDHVRQFKQQNIQLLQKHHNNLEQLLQSNRKKAEEIRSSQVRLKQKLKKYEQYKSYIAKINYTQKLQSQYFKHKENKRYLQQIKQKVKEEDKVFKKTQKLKKQSKKIEQQFYLTGVSSNI